MFSFLNSLILPGLAAITIPIIIHFFNRRKTKKIQFSSLRFLKMLESQRIRQVRLLQILLILIRTLFILFIVLTFARPALKSVLMDSTSAKTTAVIILDDSYSMQGFNGSISRFNVAKNQVIAILNTFTNDDRVFIIPFSDVSSNLAPVNLNQSSADVLKKYIITNGSPNTSDTFKAVNRIFEDHPNYNRELYLCSDFDINRINLPDSVDKILNDRRIMCYFVNPGKIDQNNTSIDTVIVENQLFEVNKSIQFTILLKNHNNNEAMETLVNLYQGNERLAMQQAVLNPSEVKSVNLTFVPKTTGPVMLHFEIDDDNLLIDNHYYLNFTIPKKINILFVNDQSDQSLQTALGVITDNSVLKIDRQNYGQWIGRNLENYDLIVLYDPPMLGTESVKRLGQYLINKNILFIPGLNLSVREFNMMLDQLAGRSTLINLISSPGSDTYFALDANTTNLPLFESIFVKENNRIELPKIYKYFKLINFNKSILKLQNNDPLLAECKTTSENNILIFTSLLKNDWNDLPYKGFFIPMFYRILFSSAQKNQLDKAYQIGDAVAISLPDLSLSDLYTIQEPEGEAYEIIPQQSSRGLQITLDKLHKPGHYVIHKNNQFEHAFSVNISSKELEQPYVNFENLSDNVILMNTGADVSETIQSARIGQELWFVFLILALLMLLLEIILIKRIEGQGLKTK